MASGIGDDVPQWKKDLILRRRNQSKCISAGKQGLLQLSCPGRGASTVDCPEGHEPRIACSSAAQPVASGAFPWKHVAKYDVSRTTRVVNSNSKVHNSKMVQDCTWIEEQSFTMVSKTDEYDNKQNSDTDSSEELQYGPGIVSKLKNKYLSLTLREQNVRARPTILPMRRAASLEDLLDDDAPVAGHKVNGTGDLSSANGNSRRFESRINGASVKTKNIQNRYRNSSRGNESLKRARSVETISSRQESPVPNEDDDANIGVITTAIAQKQPEGNEKPNNGRITPNDKEMLIQNVDNKVRTALNKPKRLAPLINDKEKPPCDVVKHNKMIFEGRPEKRTKPPHKTGEVAAKLANFKAIIDQNKKPPIKPKPEVQVEKSSNAKNNQINGNNANRPGSPRKSWKNSLNEKPPKVPSTMATPIQENWSGPTSPDVASLPSPQPDVSRTNDFMLSPAENNRLRMNSSLSETPDLIKHSSPNPSLYSPTSVKIATDVFIKTETKHIEDLYITPPSKPLENFPYTNGHYDRLSKYPPPPRPSSAEPRDDHDSGLKLTQETQKNARKDSNSITYALKTSSNSKSHLPKTPASPTNDKATVEPSSAKLISNGAKERPLPPIPVIIGQDLTNSSSASSKSYNSSPSSVPNNNKLKELYVDTQPSSRPLVSASSGKNLTEREIKKNLINTEKTLEQPVIKTTVSVKKSVEEVTPPKYDHILKPQRKWSQEQEPQQFVFNFLNRPDVPDYIEDDGMKKVRPSGGISIPGASQGESSTEDDDWQLSLGGPPSPCDVLFINDNILIDGRSSLSSKTKKPKMRIKFIETNPEIFEYPSESSLLDEISPTMPISNTASTPSTTTGHSVPSLNGCSSLANYTPKSGFSVEDFQLGVTRSAPAPPTNIVQQNQPATDLILQEADDPVLFSAGTNSDILF